MAEILSFQNRLTGLLAVTCLLAVAFYLLRSKRLAAQYALVWIVSGLLMYLVLLWDWLPLTLTRLIGATNVSSTVFFFGFFLLIGLILELLVRISDASNKIRQLSQEVGLLKNELEDGRKIIGQPNLEDMGSTNPNPRPE